jgi:hypothetical protein
MAKPTWLGRNKMESKQEGRKRFRFILTSFLIKYSSLHGSKLGTRDSTCPDPSGLPRPVGAAFLIKNLLIPFSVSVFDYALLRPSHFGFA